MKASYQCSALSCRLARRGPVLRGLGGAGFTLLELLVAASITAVLAGFLAVIIGNVAKSWTRASGRLGADAQARLVLDQLQLDLQGAIYRDDGNVWLSADIVDTTTNAGNLWTEAARNPKPNGGLSLDVASTRTELQGTDRGRFDLSRYGKAGVWLRFFTTRRGSNDAITTTSAPVAVGYQLIRRFSAANPTNTTSQAYLLHRSQARPATANSRPGVLESGYNLDPSVATNYTRTSSTNDGSQTGDPRGVQVPGTNQGAVRNLDAVIADNVIDFGIRAYVRDDSQPGGLRLIFPALAVVGAGGDVTLRPGYSTLFPKPTRLRSSLPSSTSVTAANFDTLMPDVVDVMLRVLTDEGAAQIANLEKNQTPALVVPQKYQGNAQAWWWGVATENSRVFTRRIVLNAKSL